MRGTSCSQTQRCLRSSTYENIYSFCTSDLTVTECLHMSVLTEQLGPSSISNTVPELISLLLINSAHLLPHFCISLQVFHNTLQCASRCGYWLRLVSVCMIWVENMKVPTKRVGPTTHSTLKKKLHCMFSYTPGMRFQFPNKTLGAPAVVEERVCIAFTHKCSYRCINLYFALMCLWLSTTLHMKDTAHLNGNK